MVQAQPKLGINIKFLVILNVLGLLRLQEKIFGADHVNERCFMFYFTFLGIQLASIWDNFRGFWTQERLSVFYVKR